ncbi:MAG: hypothetical protein SOT10_03350 [Oscillospiraceae bacterium]|nr:hypothetical protein [Oscillospiraceae bacterium]
MKKSKRFLFIALAVTLMLSACVKTEQDSSSGDSTSSQTGDISSSQIDEISSSQSESGTSSSGASSQTEYAPAITETYEKYNDLSFMPPEAKKVYEENENLLGHMLASPTSVVYSDEYERLLDADGRYVYFQPEDCIGKYMVVDAKYEDFKEWLSEFCTERKIACVLRGFRNYNGYLAAEVADRPLSGFENDGNMELYDVYTVNDEQITFLYVYGTCDESKVGRLVELVKENGVWKFNYMEQSSISGGKLDPLG